MKNSKQSQKSGDSSVNIQAHEITVTGGLSYDDVKQIALDIFKANFLELSGIAAETAQKRAEEITEKFLNELMTRNPSGLATAHDPDMQYAIFTVEKEYARSGEKELGDILVDLLVDRTKEENRTILQIVLNESLGIVPKLTKDQLDVLSIVFSLRYTKYLLMDNLDSLRYWFDYRISPFVESITKRASCYQHLAYSGCASLSIGVARIERLLKGTYPGLFSKGFAESAVLEMANTYGVSTVAFARCLHDPALFQVNAIDNSAIEGLAKKLNLSDEATSKLLALQESRLMKDAEIKECLRTIHPCMEKLFDTWDNSPMGNMSLTSVGIAIGHANARRITKETDDLSIWIN